jgi:hypothetical protein
MPKLETWTFRIVPLPNRVPAANRVRSALKVLLRSFGLRCTAILDLPPDPAGTPTLAPAGSGTVKPAGEPSPATRAPCATGGPP